MLQTNLNQQNAKEHVVQLTTCHHFPKKRQIRFTNYLHMKASKNPIGCEILRSPTTIFYMSVYENHPLKDFSIVQNARPFRKWGDTKLPLHPKTT